MIPTCQCEHPMCCEHNPGECEDTAFVAYNGIPLCLGCAILVKEYEGPNALPN